SNTAAWAPPVEEPPDGVGCGFCGGVWAGAEKLAETKDNSKSKRQHELTLIRRTSVTLVSENVGLRFILEEKTNLLCSMGKDELRDPGTAAEVFCPCRLPCPMLIWNQFEPALNVNL